MSDTVTQAFLEVIERYGKRLEEHIYYTDTIKTVFRYKVYNEEYLVVKENGKCLEIINIKELTGNARLTRKSGIIFC